MNATQYSYLILIAQVLALILSEMDLNFPTRRQKNWLVT